MPGEYRKLSGAAGFVAGFLLCGLAGCSLSPQVVGPVHPPIPATRVTVFERPYLPPHYVVVARLDATGYGGKNLSLRIDAWVLQRLCRQAARLGASGIILSPTRPVAGYNYGPPSIGPHFVAIGEFHRPPRCGTPSTRYCYRLILERRTRNMKRTPFTTAMAVDLPRGLSRSARWRMVFEKVRKYFPQCGPQDPPGTPAR